MTPRFSEDRIRKRRSQCLSKMKINHRTETFFLLQIAKQCPFHPPFFLGLHLHILQLQVNYHPKKQPNVYSNTFKRPQMYKRWMQHKLSIIEVISLQTIPKAIIRDLSRYSLNQLYPPNHISILVTVSFTLANSSMLGAY